MTMIDTHAHLDMEPFNTDREEVIARAAESGVSLIITVGIDLPSSEAAVQLAQDYPEVLATVGFHPHESARTTREDINRIGELARQPRVVAIGEMGLDFFRDYAPREEQLQTLRWQLDLADEINMPVVIHCRRAERDMLLVLRDWASHRENGTGSPGVIHCFSSDEPTLEQYLEMDFYISLGAYITYPSSRQMYSIIRRIPRDRLLVETDAPYLPPQDRRGKRNEPAYVPVTVGKLAEIIGVPRETVAEETTRNARRVFHLPQTRSGTV